jgi:hypothetical protein
MVERNKWRARGQTVLFYFTFNVWPTNKYFQPSHKSKNVNFIHIFILYIKAISCNTYNTLPPLTSWNWVHLSNFPVVIPLSNMFFYGFIKRTRNCSQEQVVYLGFIPEFTAPNQLACISTCYLHLPCFTLFFRTREFTN